MDVLIRYLDVLNRTTTRIAGYFATGLLFAMLGVVIVHVFYRYVLNDSFGWTEELSRTMMVWMAFLYFPTAHRYGMNVSLDIFIAAIQDHPIMRYVGLLIELSVFVMLCGAIWLGWGLMSRASSSFTLALQLPLGYVYAIMPVGFTLVALVSFERLLRLVANIFYPGRYKVNVFGSSTAAGG
ncbi:TRAP transporter small permease [Roseinatronobacter sp.]|uniref:TRAP transporter small permease n=1 Tax=Roseinatronobacter sp. TaxID=1945755 RepID=UPI0025E69438|nr:TRAP transporter small permease [Rhodobaca sp.]